MYFTPEDFFNVFIRLLSQVFIRDAPGISEKDENRSKSTKVTKGKDAKFKSLVANDRTDWCLKDRKAETESARLSHLEHSHCL